MLYRMLCNRLPFRAKSQPELVRQIREDEPQPPRQLVPNLPMELERICLKAMAKAAADRYTTAGDMAQEIRALLQGNVPARRHERPAEATRVSAPAARVQRRHLSFLAVSWEAAASDEEVDVDDQAEMSAAFKRRCTEIVTRYSGTILRADSHTLVVCFGYPTAQEDAARRATHAAIEIRELLRRDGQKAPRGWVSVHTGTVVVRAVRRRQGRGDRRAARHRRAAGVGDGAGRRVRHPRRVAPGVGSLRGRRGRQPPGARRPGAGGPVPRREGSDRLPAVRVGRRHAHSAGRPRSGDGPALQSLEPDARGTGPGGDAHRRRGARQVPARPRPALARHG